MSSFSLWFDSSNSNNEDFKAEVHFNLWNMHYRKAMPPCLDIGIKINNTKECNSIYFYVPFIIKKSEVIDLGNTMKSSDILCSIFNENYVAIHQSGEKIIKVHDSKLLPIMNIYCLNTNSNIALENNYGGTLISISFPDALKGEELPSYFRFRLKSKEFKQIIKRYKPDNIFFQSARTTLEAIDFRFNDYRSMDSSLLEMMRQGVNCSIEKVHFLLLTEADVELHYYSSQPTARELENKIWLSYFQELQNKSIVAYHWKFKKVTEDKLENCIMFVKTKIHKCNWKTVIAYIIALGILTIAFDYLSLLLF